MKPYSDDWENIRPDLQYSKHLDLYWYKGKVYDQLSASHNGIIGLGYVLKQVIKES